MRSPVIKILAVTVAVVLYPTFTHLAVVNGFRWVALAIAAVILAILLKPLWARRTSALAGLAIVAVLIAVFAFLGRLTDLIYLPPILITSLLLIVFGWTLLPGKVPLLTRYATMVRGPLPPRLQRYTRSITVLWTAFFLVLSMECTALALFAPVEIWSLFANGINYVATVTLFLGEYAYRRYRFSDLHHPGLIHYIRLIRETGLRPTPGEPSEPQGPVS